MSSVYPFLVRRVYSLPDLRLSRTVAGYRFQRYQERIELASTVGALRSTYVVHLIVPAASNFVEADSAFS